MEMRLEGQISLLPWWCGLSTNQGQKSACTPLDKSLLPTKIFLLEEYSAGWGLGDWILTAVWPWAHWVMWASHLCSVWLIGGTWITLQFNVPGSSDASRLLGFLPSHSWALYREILHNRGSGGSVKSEGNPDVEASPSLSYKPDTAADRSFAHAQFYAH